MKLSLGKMMLAGVVGALLASQAYAGVFTLDFAAGTTETELVADQNSTNANNLFGSAGSGNSKLVGSVNSGRDEFIALSIDLSTIPDTDIVTSVTLEWGTDGADGNSVFTTNPINLFELVADPDTTNGFNFRYQSFGPDASSAAADRADNVHWDLVGMGDIPTGTAVASDFLGTPLSSIAASGGSTGGTTYDATSAAAGQTYEFVSSAAFVSAVQSNLVDDQLWLVFGIDALDVGPDDGLRSFLRFAEDSAVLKVNTIIPEPASLALLGLGGLVMLRRRG